MKTAKQLVQYSCYYNTKSITL